MSMKNIQGSGELLCSSTQLKCIYSVAFWEVLACIAVYCGNGLREYEVAMEL